jgi:hypothetical protein
MVDTTKPYFPHNWQTGYFIDTAGGLDPAASTTASFASLAAFVTGVTPAPNDVSDTSIYFADEDNASPEKTGSAYTWAVTGHVLVGDPACNYILNLYQTHATGNAAKTLLKIVYPNGKTLITRVVVQSIVVGGGNGNAKETLTFTLAESGKGILSDTVSA